VPQRLSRLNRSGLEQAARTTIAASVSFAIAKALRLSEPHWAAISTIVVILSAVGAAFTVSRQRFLGTAMGAAAGALLAMWLGTGLLAFAVGVFGLGLVCAVARLDRAAYRFAGITLAIIVLAPLNQPAWVTAIQRFIEVALGIAVGLAITRVWPERGVLR
jgi:uncharacterized membrane protein YccC